MHTEAINCQSAGNFVVYLFIMAISIFYLQAAPTTLDVSCGVSNTNNAIRVNCIRTYNQRREANSVIRVTTCLLDGRNDLAQKNLCTYLC